MRRCLSWMAVVLAATAVLAGCGSGSSGANAKNELVFSASLGPATWDPHTETRAFVYGWYTLVYDGLVTTDAGGKVIPGLATQWKLTPTSLSMTLASGVKFADGTPFNADAVRWNITTQQSQTGTAAVLKSISDVQVVDEQHVVLHLSQPAPDLVEQLAGFPGLMVSPKVSETDLQAGKAAGTGPYVLDTSASQKDTSYVFTPNKGSWETGMAHFTKVVGDISADDVARANALRSNQVDVAYISPAQVDSLGSKYKVSTAPAYIQSFIVLDAGGKKLPALAQEKVRQAISLAIDRKAFVADVDAGYATPVDQLFAEGQVGHVDGYTAPAVDLTKAKELMKEAGVESVSIAAPTWGSFSLANQWLQSALAKIGVKLQLDTVAPGQDITGIIGGKYPAVYTYVPDRHPQSAYAKYLAQNAPYNPFHYVDPLIERYDTQAVDKMADVKASDAAYSELMRHAYETGRIIPIAQYKSIIAYSPTAVSDVAAWSGITGSFYIRDVKPVE